MRTRPNSTADASAAPLPAADARAGKPASRVRWPLLLAGLAALVFATLVVLYGLSRAADRTSVWRVSETVGRGQPLTAEALAPVGVATDNGLGELVLVTDTSPIGQVATHELRPGALLSRTDFTTAPSVGPEEKAVGAVLRPGRIPIDVVRGDIVYAVAADGDPTLLVPARVIDIRGVTSAQSSTGNGATAVVRQGTEVVLAVPTANAGPVAQLAANDKLVLVREPRA